ncbi:MAG: antibiotic biosynthesis monooxygenase [Synechococcaceae cyanobacterium ELA445]|jgi:antibiotic biosynthesis monooxygenase (ABM) superfamily enzyme
MAQARSYVAVTRQVRPGQEAAFEESLRGMLAEAEAFEGYVGGEVHVPSRRHGPWHLVLRFETPEQFRTWEDSAPCQRWIERANALSSQPPTVVRGNALEAWVALPELPAAQPPPKWKTTLLSALGLYPLILLVPGLLGPITVQLPAPLRTLLNLAVMMPLMSWVVMPQVSRLFRRWLYP